MEKQGNADCNSTFEMKLTMFLTESFMFLGFEVSFTSWYPNWTSFYEQIGLWRRDKSDQWNSLFVSSAGKETFIAQVV